MQQEAQMSMQKAKQTKPGAAERANAEAMLLRKKKNDEHQLSTEERKIQMV